MSHQEHSEIIPIRTQRVPQSIETPVTFVSAPGAYVRYAYSRSGDSMASHIEGQDYLCFQHNDQRFVFVVADGVGSSFCGNLAARILGDGLLEWLWAADIMTLGGASALAEAATSALNRLQKQARHEVEEYKIPDQISPLVRQALEAQRAYGSEAVFVAMRIDHPSPMIPDGLISLAWMGDSQMHVYDETGSEMKIGGKWDNTNRWSTTQGARGAMSSWMQELTGIGRITAFTDGLAAHAAKLMDYSDDTLDRAIRAGAKLPTSDDVALIDVTRQTPQYEGYPDVEVPDLAMERPSLEPIWNPAGASTYELHWNWPGQANASFMVQEASSPALTDATVMNVIAKGTTWKPEKPQVPGLYYYRVRAVTRRSVVTPWSELRQTRVAYPPPPAPELRLDESQSAPSLTWEVDGDSLDFTLEQAGNPDFAEAEIVYFGRNTAWVMPSASIQPGTYYFRAQAVSDGGASPWSTALRTEVTLPPPPRPHLAAASFPMSGSMRSYELRWQAVPGATRYELEEHEQRTDDIEVFSTPDAMYRRDDPEEGHYVYRVRACHETGCSEWSNEQTVIIAAQPPDGSPEIIVDGPDESGIVHVSWLALERATGYEIEISQDEAFHHARVMSCETPAVEIIRRDPGQIFFRARAINTGGAGVWGTPARLVISPAMPDWIEARVAATGRLSVSWANAGSKVEYALQLSPDGAEDSFVEVYRGQDTQYEFDPPLSTSGVLRVRAEAGGIPSAWQGSPVIAGEISLSAPLLDITEGEVDGIHLHWNTITGATHYVIEAAREEQFSAVNRQETSATGAVFHPSASGRYWLRVRAARGDQAGPPSNIASVQAQQPGMPSLWPIDPVKEKALFDIAWTGVPGCAYYELQGSSDSAFAPAQTSSVRVNHPSQKFTVPGRSTGVFYYRVRAIDENGQVSLWSKTLTVEVI